VLGVGLAGLAAVAPNASARDDTTPDPWMTDRYEIEIVVFRHRDQSRNTPEQRSPGEIEFSGLDLSPPAQPRTAGPYADPYAGLESENDRDTEMSVTFHLLELEPKFPDFVSLTEDRLQFGDVVARLTEIDAYEPLLHRAWLQAARPAVEAIPREIESTEPGQYGVSGTITLYKERYAHLEVDLKLTRDTPAIAQPTEPSWPVFGDVFLQPERDQAPLRSADAMTFELRESRRIRGTNAQYFDNPQFGLIARISKVEFEAD
jgi:hypothetical protein